MRATVEIAYDTCIHSSSLLGNIFLSLGKKKPIFKGHYILLHGIVWFQMPEKSIAHATR